MKLSFGQYGNLLITYLRPQGHRVVALAALLLSSIALQIANPQLLRPVIQITRQIEELQKASAGIVRVDNPTEFFQPPPCAAPTRSLC